MTRRATGKVLAALGVCAAVAVCALYVTTSTAQSPDAGQAQAESNAAPIYGITLPDGYRDWRLISVNHLAGGPLKQVRAQLGNDIAIKAFREVTRPFPDGTIIAALHWSEAFRRKQQNPGPRLSRRWPCLFRARVGGECSVHGQGLEEVRRDGRLGICRLQER
jgi:hypothetical protein